MIRSLAHRIFSPCGELAGCGGAPREHAGDEAEDQRDAASPMSVNNDCVAKSVTGSAIGTPKTVTSPSSRLPGAAPA